MESVGAKLCAPTRQHKNTVVIPQARDLQTAAKQCCATANAVRQDQSSASALQFYLQNSSHLEVPNQGIYL